MQILLGLILLQLLQSCDYSKSRDVLWMKNNFENEYKYDRHNGKDRKRRTGHKS